MTSLGNHEWDFGNVSTPANAWCAPWSCSGNSGTAVEASGGDCGIPYRLRLGMPEGSSSSAQQPMVHGMEVKPRSGPELAPIMEGFKAYYSLDAGPVHLAWSRWRWTSLLRSTGCTQWHPTAPRSMGRSNNHGESTTTRL